MRDFYSVANKILGCVPKEEKHLREKIESVITSSLYTAPELMARRWSSLSLCLNDNLPWPPKYDWQKMVYLLITGKEYEKDED